MGSLFTGVGGFDLGFERAGVEIAWQVETEKFCVRVLESRFPKVKRRARDISDCARCLCRQLTSSVRAFPARMSQSQASGRDSRKGSVLDSFTSLRESCASFDPLGLCSKMFPDFSVRTRGETLGRSSAFSWSNAVMGFQGVCSTANFSESPSVVAVCSLSDILESHVPQRFFLSPRAAQGILRRAEKRGRMLPPRLRLALEALSSEAEGIDKIRSSQLHSANPMDTTGEAAHAEMDATTSSPPRSRAIGESSRMATATISKLSPHRSPGVLPSITEPARGRTATRTISSPRRSARDHSTHRISRADAERMTLTLFPLSTAEDATEDSTPSPESTSSSRMFAAEERSASTESGFAKAGHATRSQKLTAMPSQSQITNHKSPMSVRRLTPTECEILQGFRKGWTVPATGRSATRSQFKSRSGSRKGS